MNFRVGWSRKESVHSQSRERQASVQIDLGAPLDLERWEKDWLRPLTHLLSLGSREIVRPEEFTAISVPGGEEQSLHAPGALEVHVVSPQRTLRREPKFEWERYLVTLTGLGADFEMFLQRWWHTHRELAGAADFLFGALGEGMSLEPQMVALASVMEGYHRAFGDPNMIDPETHEGNVQKMIEAVADEDVRKHYRRHLQHAYQHPARQVIRAQLRDAGEAVPELRKKAGRLAEAIVKSRDYFVHLPVERPQVLQGTDIYEANQLMILALRTNVLLRLGMPADELRRRIERSYATEPFWEKLRKRGTAWPKASKAGGR